VVLGLSPEEVHLVGGYLEEVVPSRVACHQEEDPDAGLTYLVEACLVSIES